MAMPSCLNGTDLAIWRSASGQAFVWGDRCPHRGMRLSQGFVRQDTLACIYHGWQYGSDGGCVSIPAHPDLVPPKTICATTYTSIEEGGLIWTSLSETQDAPPQGKTHVPVRSLLIEAPLRNIAAHFGAVDAVVLDVTAPEEITLALQPVSPERAMVHVMTAEAKNRKLVSRWLETQRADIERAVA